MKFIRLGFAVGGLLLSIGCSSINLNTAKNLADNGSNASLQIADAYGQRSVDLEQYLEGENILAGLKKGYSIPDQKLVVTVDAVKAEMLQRQEIFNNLVNTYEAFSQLAVYDESEQVETSIRNLTAAVNDYSRMTQNKVVFTQPQEDLAAIAGSQLFEKYHELKVKKASALIRERLQAIQQLLTAKTESSAVRAMEKEIDRNQLQVAIALWQEGLGLPTEIIASHIENYGLKVNRKETVKQVERATQGKMQQAIENVMKFRNQRRIRQRDQAYEAAIQSVQALITAHHQLENGQEISIESLHNFLQKVNRYANIAKAMKEAKNE